MAELDYDYLANLVEKTQEGASEAFAELYAATYQKQYRFAYQYVKDPYLAQDILQEVYILVLKNIKKLKNPRLFVSWLHQINFRVCFDMYKKQLTHSQELKEIDASFWPSFPCTSSDPAQQLAHAGSQKEIMDAVLSLPAREAEAIIMKYYNDMKLEDIAMAMDCSRSTIKRYLAQGREALSKVLDNPEGGKHVG